LPHVPAEASLDVSGIVVLAGAPSQAATHASMQVNRDSGRSRFMRPCEVIMHV
jgi:hypothetical protein